MLDYRVVEFALSLPRQHKVAGPRTKIILKEVLARYLPPALFERPKKGFDSPIASWLRGPLKAWAHDLLDTAKINADGLLDPEPIRQKWVQHQAGDRNHQYFLWNVLMFQEWKCRWA